MQSDKKIRVFLGAQKSSSYFLIWLKMFLGLGEIKALNTCLITHQPEIISFWESKFVNHANECHHLHRSNKRTWLKIDIFFLSGWNKVVNQFNQQTSNNLDRKQIQKKYSDVKYKNKVNVQPFFNVTIFLAWSIWRLLLSRDWLTYSLTHIKCYSKSDRLPWGGVLCAGLKLHWL